MVHNNILSNFSAVVVHGTCSNNAWVVTFVAFHIASILWVLHYRKCGLADHSVVESVNLTLYICYLFQVGNCILLVSRKASYCM